MTKRGWKYMEKLTEFINKQNKFHLKNLYIEINEELRKLINTSHSIERKDQAHNSSKNILKKEIESLINKCDDLIIDKLLNNKIQINKKEEQFGIRKIENKSSYKTFACIFEVVFFNKETFDYDLKLITANKVKYVYNFLPNTKFAFEIDKSNYVKEIKI